MPIEPNFGHLSQLGLLAKQVVEGFITGLHKSPFHGFSVEFAEHRQYNVGDNTKNIDWKLYAKTDKLFSKRYEEETNLRCHFVLDTSSSMNFPHGNDNKLNFSIKSIAVLIQLLKQQRDAFSLSMFADRLIFTSQAKTTTSHQKYLLDELSQRMDSPPQHAQTDLPAALHQVAELTHKRSMIVVFSDFLQQNTQPDQLTAFIDALQHLKFNKHEVVLFNVLDKAKEVDFDFGNKPYSFIDLESGHTIKASAAAIKESYQHEVQRYLSEMKLRCAQYKIDWVDADISAGYFQILEAYLIKRKKMS
jgi:uncharacterized protein (DUF58 family)